MTPSRTFSLLIAVFLGVNISPKMFDTIDTNDFQVNLSPVEVLAWVTQDHTLNAQKVLLPIRIGLILTELKPYIWEIKKEEEKEAEKKVNYSSPHLKIEKTQSFRKFLMIKIFYVMNFLKLQGRKSVLLWKLFQLKD